MKKVLLVNPAIAYSSWKANLDSSSPDNVFIRLGLAYLAGALIKRGHEVSLIDLRVLSGWTEFEQEVARIAPDVAGISIHTIEMPFAREAAERIKKVSPGSLIVAGGIHPTMFSEECLQTGLFDYVMKGEGEISFPDFVEEPSRFPEIFWGESPDLNQIPFPVRDVWKDYGKRIGSHPFRVRQFEFKLPMAEMIITRGCPFRCGFCCGPGEQQLYTKVSSTGKRIPYIRGRNVDNVINEIKFLRKKYRINSVMFHDDHFFMDRTWSEKFIGALHAEGLVKAGFEWVTSSRADIICKYENLIGEAAGAGLKLLIIGFESFSPKILKWFNKSATVEDNFKSAEICKKYGIKIWANYILGVPTDEGWRPEDDFITIDGVLRVDPVHYSPSFYTPVLGSPLYAWYKDNDLIIEGSTDESLGERSPLSPKVKSVDYEFLRNVMIA